MIYLYLGIATAIVGLFIWARMERAGRQKEKKLKETAQKRAAETQRKAEKQREQVQKVLDFETTDKSILAKQEEHLNILVQTRSKNVAKKELEKLRSDLFDAYNSGM